MPDHMLNLPLRPLALMLCLAFAGMPAGSWAQDPKPTPPGGAATRNPPKPPADVDDPGTHRPGDKVMKVQTESEKAETEREKEKARPASSGESQPTRPSSP